jgi:hypothetical protein
MANADVVDLILLCQHDIPDNEAFCSLDHAAEIPADYGDPFLLCARKERAFDSPLAFHAYETEPEVTVLAVSVGGERHVII